MSDKESSWWEFYGVRYAQGSVVGAMLVFFLFSQHPDLKRLLFVPTEADKFGVPHLILLAVYGLAYCYIASAPILLMHAVRGLLFKSLINPNPYRGWWRRAVFVLGATVLSTLIYYFLHNPQILKVGAFLLMAFLMSFQFCILWEIFYGSWDRVMRYYDEIVKKRKAHADSGFVESYKHIREHGNSFLIVLFEFALAIPIYFFVSRSSTVAQEGISNMGLIILLWILPASLVWFFGNKLENHLQDM